MLSEPETIFVQTELLIPQVEELQITKTAIRRLYNQLLDEPGGYPYENLDLQADSPTLSTRRESGHSLCQFDEFTIRIEEDRPQFPVDEFTGVVTTILDALGDACPPFVGQRCRIQCLSQVNKSENSLFLLAGKVANVLGPIEPFERIPSLFGVRFRFVPSEMLESDEEEANNDDSDASASEVTAGEQDTPATDHPSKEHEGQSQVKSGSGFVVLRFETYEEDISKVWMEVAATFPVFSGLTRDQAIENIQECYDFLTRKCKRFLDQFEETDEG